MSDLCAEGRHDWRVHPYLVLLTHPPRQRLVCARCEASSSRPHSTGRADTYDPADKTTWPLA